MKRIALTTILAALALAAAPLVSASTIVSWETFGNSGNEPLVAPTNVETGLVGLNLERGPGLNATNATNSFNSNSWTWLGGVRQADDYVSFGFEVQAPFKVDDLRLLFGSRSSNTGPGPMGLFWEGDNFASPIHTWTQGGTSWSNEDIDLSALGTFEAGSYEFRFQSIANESAGNPDNAIAGPGTWRVGDILQSGQFGLFRFEGTVTPEPGRAMLLAIGGLLFLARRRRA